MGDKKLVITIGRQYGSGGNEIGRKLAGELGIDFYDKNILRMNSDESGIKESYFHLADEKAGNRLLYRIIRQLLWLVVILQFRQSRMLLSESHWQSRLLC